MNVAGSRLIRTLNPIARKTPEVAMGEWRARTYPAESKVDWIGTRNGPTPYTNALAPGYGEEVFTSTPYMMWPDLGASHTYEVRIYKNGVLHCALTSDAGVNLLVVPLANALPLESDYTWTVKSLTDPVNYPESTPRYFYVRAEATPYVIDLAGSSPTFGERLYDKILGLNGQTALPIPRSISSNTAIRANMLSAFSRSDVRFTFVKFIDQMLPTWSGEASITETNLMPNNSLVSLLHQTFSLSAYWKLGGTSAANALTARNILKRKLSALITYWDGTVGTKRGYGTINGIDQTSAKTDYIIQNQDCRYFVLLLGLMYDLFKIGSGSGTDFTAAEQARLLEYADYRVKQMFDSFYTGRSLLGKQFESHGSGAIGYLAYCCALLAENDMSSFPTTYGLAGNIPLVIKTLLPQWLWTSAAFRTDDGSAHNGGEYDDFDSVAQPMIVLTLQMFGITLMDKPRFYNGPSWRVYMNGIPGSRTRSQFGDGASEHTPNPAAYGALMYRYPSPLTRYLYKDMQNINILQQYLGFTPLRGNVPNPSPPAVLSKVFPTGGYYCSLSSFTNPNATAVYLRSSLHGGFNHAHHDMNSIVLWGGNAASGPRQLLIDSGYYDQVDFGPPHHANWHRQSRAHNVISMDGGLGEQQGSIGDTNTDMLSKGKLICWKDTGAYSYVIGDATQSYTVPSYTLSSAQRAVVHFRDDVVVVFDYALSSSGNHVFDWNFHTDNAIAHSAGVYTVTSGTVKAYIKNQYCNTALMTPITWASGSRSSGHINYSGWDGPLGWSGTVTSGTTTSLTDSTASWTVDQYKNAWVTVNGSECKVTSNTATTMNLTKITFSIDGNGITTFGSGTLSSAATGTYTVAPYWNPGPPSLFAGRQQYHHRISTAAAVPEYKAVTTISVNSNSLISNVSTSTDSQSITFSATIQGKNWTAVFNFVNQTMTIT